MNESELDLEWGWFIDIQEEEKQVKQRLVKRVITNWNDIYIINNIYAIEEEDVENYREEFPKYSEDLSKDSEYYYNKEDSFYKKKDYYYYKREDYYKTEDIKTEDYYKTEDIKTEDYKKELPQIKNIKLLITYILTASALIVITFTI
jgi:hypothetical protein